MAWTEGLDEELTQHAAAKGWDKLEDPVQAAHAILKSHKAAESFFGTPKENLLKLPAADAQPDEIKAFWERLGAPGKPEGYDLSDVKYKSGDPLDQEFADFLRQTGVELNVPASVVKHLATKFAEFADAGEAEENTAKATALANNKTALAQQWGGENSAVYTMNMAVAQKAAQAAGVDPAALTALESVVGYPAVMEMFRKLGVQTGEASNFVARGQETNDKAPPMDLAGAMQRRDELMADKDWALRWANGGAKEGQEMYDLLQVILSQGGRIGGTGR